MTAEFDRFWSFYPKRKGSMPKAPAKKKFVKLVDSGENAEYIIAGAKAYAIQESHNINTPYIAMPTTWLNQRRWEDYPMPINGQGSPPVRVFVEVDSPQWKAWVEHRMRSQGRYWPQYDFKVDGRYRRGWWFETEWPPQA